MEDYRAYYAPQGILITLSNQTYTAGGSAQASCTQRYRVVVAEESMTADVQKNIFAMLLAARLSGDNVRLFVNPTNNLGAGYCAVQIASIGQP